MRYIRFEGLIIIFILCLFVINGHITHGLIRKNNEMIDDLRVLVMPESRYKLYDTIRNETVKETTKLNGVYDYSSEIYCVWEKGRTLDNIERTERHEYCHWLVHNDYEHFCKGKE